MSIYDEHYFYLNKLYLRILGLWPYDGWKGYIIRTIYLLLIAILSVPHLIGTIKHHSDIDKMMEHLMYVLFLIAVFCKMFTVSISNGKMVIMLDAITENYALIVNFEEREIMINFAEEARKITIAYSIIGAACSTLFFLLPLYTVIFDLIVPPSVPRERTSFLNGEYLVENKDEYFWLIYFFDTLSVCLVAVVALSVDTMYVACICHCLGLFAIIKHRLQKPRQLIQNAPPGADADYETIKDIIILHQRVLEFTEILNNSYSLCFLVLMLCHVTSLPISSICILIRIDQPLQLLRYMMSFVALTGHQLCINWPAQILADANADLFHEAEWYESSPRTKNLLRFFWLRCTKPTVITAGGIMDMGMANFYGIMKKAISYITVLSSFR